jgi:hypothetical protein
LFGEFLKVSFSNTLVQILIYYGFFGFFFFCDVFGYLSMFFMVICDEQKNIPCGDKKQKKQKKMHKMKIMVSTQEHMNHGFIVSSFQYCSK